LRTSPAFLAAALSRGSWRRAAHLDLIARRLTAAATERDARIKVEVPVRHGKSELISHWFPVWYLPIFRGRVVLSTYSDTFSAHWGRRARNSLQEHAQELEVDVSRDSRGAHEFELTGGGGMLSVGREGGLTGRGANFLLIDDPIKNREEADSPTIREKVWDFWTSTARTRLEPGAAVVLIMSRWSRDDLSGRLEARDPGAWETIRLPAIAEEGDVLGRAPGEALWRWRFDEAALALAKKEVGSRDFAALFQQSPLPDEGALVKKQWLRYFREREDAFVLETPEGERRIPLDKGLRFATVDLAVSQKTTADYFVIGSWHLSPARELLLLDIVRARLEGPDQIPALRRTMSRFDLSYAAIERAGYQLALIQDARRQGLRVRELGLSGIERQDKLARATPFAVLCESGQVYLRLGAPWLGDYETEILEFPGAAHDDQMDVSGFAAIEAGKGIYARPTVTSA
jgi:predicted phage terminase large subunit-like protein